ncbi:endonuclease [Pseudoalteromonas obscura]|uniref:Endonuclease n=1 Tax=Pseudoalteromonas obscura TaxID=3048491 RepID=A0ABT7ETJ0_9GAMM|nr:endonuclease [Pseudoalteromonas sp. P94(2023)]MDK2598348.1 endonuclease [Pseudoalteromonas sp. P94(2023)]
MKHIIFLLTGLAMVSPTFADESEYKKVRDKVFWLKLYNQAYETFYCGKPKKAGDKVTLEHIYPTTWIAESLKCTSRKSCKHDKYREATSDLHNLWPAEKRYKISRQGLPFGVIPEKNPYFKNDSCNFERTLGKKAIVEPRDEIKGQVARSLLYMIHYYDLPHKDMLPLLIKWHTEYPPTLAEIERQDRIEAIQGRTNEFVKGNI